MTTGIDVTRPLEGVLYEKRGGIAFITINRPDKGNSLTRKMEQVFRAVWADVRDDPAVRVSIVTGAGDRHFSTGFDVSTAGEGSVAPDLPLDEAVFWSPRQNHVWKPTLCAVNGLVVGGGLHFVVDADIVIAADTAAFMDTHVNVGMVGALENIGLAKRLPLGTALRMTLMGKHYRLTAQRAFQLGMVDELAKPGELLKTAEEMANVMLSNSPTAMARSQQAIWGSLERGYHDAMEHGWALLRLQWSHPDFLEGARAFVEKREPSWDPNPDATHERKP
jgi:enoyl-CoA hydratase/carnithine racemase